MHNIETVGGYLLDPKIKGQTTILTSWQKSTYDCAHVQTECQAKQIIWRLRPTVLFSRLVRGRKSESRTPYREFRPWCPISEFSILGCASLRRCGGCLGSSLFWNLLFPIIDTGTRDARPVMICNQRVLTASGVCGNITSLISCDYLAWLCRLQRRALKLHDSTDVAFVAGFLTRRNFLKLIRG